jgi:hypothetical protein
MGEAVLDGTIMTNVKGLDAIRGYDEAKGKCVDCALVAHMPESSADEAKKLSRVDIMTIENPAIKVCNMRGAKY